MGLFDKKRHRREDMAMVRRVVDNAGEKPWYRFPPLVWELIVLVLLAAVLSVLCFWDRPSHLPILLQGTESRVSYYAQFTFQYTSQHKRQELREAQRRATPRVYRVAFEEKSKPVLTRYSGLIEAVDRQFAALKALQPEARAQVCQRLLIEESVDGLPERMREDLAHIVAQAQDKAHFIRIMREALSVLELISRKGIYEPEGQMRLYSTQSATLGAAGRNLRHSLDSLTARELPDADAQVALRDALLAIFRAGLVPNVEVDDAATRQREEAAMDKIKDEAVEVKEGAILVEKGKRITPDVLERWNAYRRQMAQQGHGKYRSAQNFVENFVPSLGILLLVAVYSRVAMPPKPRKRRSITLMAVLVLVNLAMIRLALHFGESMPVQRLLTNSGIPSGADALIWMAPPALAAILVTLLAGPHMAILATFLVAGFSSIMLGHSMDVLFVAVIASLVGIWFSRGARNRGTVVRAGIFSGIAVAATMFLLCVSSGGLSVSELVWQVLGSMTGGLLTGAVAVAILPLLERVFKITPDIALLELTDYNHPLLRKLQLIAPGSFNHSVAVANLAEQIALVTDANSLLCRCAALFHDVGKMVKPEYFVENQRMGINPHSDINPTMSALVIKSHVREGIELAKEYKLPRVIIDIIEQHHGTGLIQYFYYKARQQSLHSASVSAAEKGTADETIFRYDGPRPRTKEAAIVLFADSMEAASRALKKVTPQSIGELVDAIIADRIRDGQLDSCPLTFSELQRIRGSLKSSLINMLHQRIVYPGATPEKEEERETDDTDEASSNK